VTGRCECGDEPSGSCVTQLVTADARTYEMTATIVLHNIGDWYNVW
jgi:hypothetical protein